jgi:hypothetical protein
MHQALPPKVPAGRLSRLLTFASRRPSGTVHRFTTPVSRQDESGHNAAAGINCLAVQVAPRVTYYQCAQALDAAKLIFR